MSYQQAEITDNDVKREIDGLNDLAEEEFEDEREESWLRDFDLEDPSNNSDIALCLDSSAGGIDHNTTKNWLFPVKNFEKRDYQLSISNSAIQYNTLVILPTGLGKTFIASVAIYNFMRYFPNSKIVFMAPTRPLVNQQMSACYDVVGIPKEVTAEMTGKIKKDKRVDLWDKKRLFFCTPQVLQYDLAEETFPAKLIKLVVIDEAHKAKGNYAYCQVIRAIYEAHNQFRVLALTATAGKSSDIIEIIQNLLISKIEYRSENSIDVCKYTHKKSIEILEVKYTREMNRMIQQFNEFIDPYLQNLRKAEAIKTFSVSKGYLLFQKEKIRNNNNIPADEKSLIMSNFFVAISMYNSLEMLERHGIHLFIKSFRDDKNVFKFFVAQSPQLKKFVSAIEENYGRVFNDITTSSAITDYGHPKFDLLRAKLQEYFEKGGSKAIVFCEFRDSTALINSVLQQLKPQVQPRILIGQGGGDMTQKEQLVIMKEFREGRVNTLVCTCVAEEGLDIGEVDLVVCFDINSKNATRFVQRIGRTGRKRNGRVIVLASEGKELHNTRDLIHKKDSMNRSITKNKSMFANHFYRAPSLFPKDFNPKCIEMKFMIPVVNEDEAEEKVIKEKKSKSKKLPKKSSSTTSIKDHFKPLKKDEIDAEINLHEAEIVDLTGMPQQCDEMEVSNKENVEASLINGTEIIEDFKTKIMGFVEQKNDAKTKDILNFRLSKRVDALKSLMDVMNLSFDAKDLSDSEEYDFEITMSKKEISQEPTDHHSRYINPFDISELQRNSSFMPVNTDFIIDNNDSPESPKYSRKYPDDEGISTPIRRLFLDDETLSPFRGFHAEQNEIMASTPVVSRVIEKKTPPPKKDIFSFLNINTIEDIFDGCTSYDEKHLFLSRNTTQNNETKSDENNVEAHFHENIIEQEEEVVESSIKAQSDQEVEEEEIIGPTQPSTPTSSSKRRVPSSDVFKNLNIESLDDLFTPLDENFKSSDKTKEYELKECSKHNNEKELSDQLSSKCIPAPIDSSLKPNISKLLCAMKSESFLFTQERIPFRENNENMLCRSMSYPSTNSPNSDCRNINRSPITFHIERPQSPIVRRRKVVKRNNHHGFLATQAAVDVGGVASSDEDDENIDNSIMTDFISNETICSQNQTHMYAKYVQSIRSPLAKRGNFKMPLGPPLVNFSQVFSQAVDHFEESYSDEEDSFVVNNDEVIEEDSEPDELEIAERKLRERNKKRKRNQVNGNVKRRKIIHDSSEEDEELIKMREELKLISE